MDIFFDQINSGIPDFKLIERLTALGRERLDEFLGILKTWPSLPFQILELLLDAVYKLIVSVAGE